MDQGPPSSLVTWSVPQCPFSIECSARVLDEIRLSVLDAFFSLPRGGAEIGGLLLGSYSPGRLSVLGYRPLECEHAFGPSFTLSERDYARLRELLAASQANPGEPQPVGWYHSHTRSEIFLSDVDREIHGRFFAQPWQVALVLKPHAFQPTRAGFFFRDPEGHIYAERSHRELLLTALPLPPEPPPRPVAPPASDPPQPRLAVPRTPPVAASSEASVAARPASLPPPIGAPLATPVAGLHRPPPPAATSLTTPPTASSPAPLIAASPTPLSGAPLVPPIAGLHRPPAPPIVASPIAASPAPPAAVPPEPPVGAPLVPPIAGLHRPPAPPPTAAAPAPPPVTGWHRAPSGPAVSLDDGTEVPADSRPAPIASGAISAPAESAPPIAPEPAPSPELALPRFLAIEPPPRKSLWPWVWLALALAAVGGCGYLTRGLWWDETVASIQSALWGGRPPALGLHAWDERGQLQIRWDPHSPALRKPRGARLTISDGAKVKGIPLDLAHLANGAFTWGRESGHVEVALAITEYNGLMIREQTAFMGAPIVSADTEGAKLTDDLRNQNEELKADLSKERDKSKRLDREVHYLRDQLEKQLRLKRLERQATPDK